MSRFFDISAPVRYEGPESSNPLAYRYYDPDKIVFGKRMEEVLRFAAAYWHTFAWDGGDPFGGETFDRAWMKGDKMEGAKLKADVAFDFFDTLGIPFFCFHDRDIAPEGDTLAESNKNVDVIADIFAKKMETSKTKLLWGTANAFKNSRFMAGAATNPDPEVFMYAGAQVKHAMDVTKRLGGQNYVLWGGREGYETLLNTDLKRELAQFARFLHLVVDYKHKIGFKGAILIEPKPQEPTKHQYDFDVATVHGFLVANGLEKEVKVNIEVGHAFLAGHTFEHEIALAGALGVFGSLDMNRNDYQSGWDTDQFPNNVGEMALALYYVQKAGGFTTGGCNFDAKVRRQSIDMNDLLIGHVGAMDVCARGLLAAEKMTTDGLLDKALADRYSGWDGAEGKAILAGQRSLEDLAAYVEKNSLEPVRKSGRQEYLENLVNRYI